MRSTRTVGRASAILLVIASGSTLGLAEEQIKLDTAEGVACVKGKWRYHEVKLVQVPGKNPDGSANTTYNIEPQAMGPDFDDSDWEVLDPTTLRKPRSTGQICFCWYRIQITAPPEWQGKQVTFFTTVDDYGEVWVDGKLPFRAGATNTNIVMGHNIPNRVELPDVTPGKTYQIAIFAMNGPISRAPGNWIFLRDTYLQISD